MAKNYIDNCRKAFGMADIKIAEKGREPMTPWPYRPPVGRELPFGAKR